MGINVVDYKARFLRSMGGEKAIVSSEEMANVLVCFLENLVKELILLPAPLQQAYGTVSEVAKVYGRNANNMRDWLRKLESQGRIRPVQGTPLREGAKGDTLYKFAEVEAALREERENNRKENK